jgi:uncharacterized protein (DUF362 family)
VDAGLARIRRYQYHYTGLDKNLRVRKILVQGGAKGGLKMNRRKFLQQVTLWSAGMLMVPPVFDISPKALGAAPSSNPDIFVAKGKDIAAMVRQMVDAMGGMSRFVNKGDTVVVKPNIGWDRNVDQGANTHPAVVTALAALVLEAGAAKVQVFDRTCNEERRCYQNSGIKPAVDAMKDRRVVCEYIDDRKFVPVKIKNGRSLTEWPFYRDALAADCYINVPVAKHHGSSGLTLGLKNAMGVIGGRRGLLHMDLGPRIADLNLVIQPDFTLVDATRILLRNGPSGGSLTDVKIMDTLVAGTDPVAVDAWATTLFGKAPEDIRSTVEGFARGLGEMDLSKCRIHML